MNIKPEEITAILEKEIESLDWKVKQEVGYVLKLETALHESMG